MKKGEIDGNMLPHAAIDPITGQKKRWTF